MFDLHTHSYCSDGTDAPELVAEKAAELGCTLFALTDHDTMNGVAAAKARSAELSLPFLTGCEIEAKYEDTLHILALGVDGENPALCELLARKEQNRIDRNRRLGERARGEPRLNDARELRFRPCGARLCKGSRGRVRPHSEARPSGLRSAGASLPGGGYRYHPAGGRRRRDRASDEDG